jgi:hypothetical protein
MPTVIEEEGKDGNRNWGIGEEAVKAAPGTVEEAVKTVTGTLE